jgi:hypothetical protein
MLVPPDTRKMIGFVFVGSMQARKTPRVTNTASAYGSSGFTVSPGFSRRLVGPWKYPWSMGMKKQWPSG